MRKSNLFIEVDAILSGVLLPNLEILPTLTVDKPTKWNNQQQYNKQRGFHVSSRFPNERANEFNTIYCYANKNKFVRYKLPCQM